MIFLSTWARIIQGLKLCRLLEAADAVGRLTSRLGGLILVTIGGRLVVVVLVATLCHRTASLGGCGGWLDGVLEGYY